MAFQTQVGSGSWVASSVGQVCNTCWGEGHTVAGWGAYQFTKKAQAQRYFCQSCLAAQGRWVRDLATSQRLLRTVADMKILDSTEAFICLAGCMCCVGSDLWIPKLFLPERDAASPAQRWVDHVLHKHAGDAVTILEDWFFSQVHSGIHGPLMTGCHFEDHGEDVSELLAQYEILADEKMVEAGESIRFRSSAELAILDPQRFAKIHGMLPFERLPWYMHTIIDDFDLLVLRGAAEGQLKPTSVRRLLNITQPARGLSDDLI